MFSRLLLTVLVLIGSMLPWADVQAQDASRADMLVQIVPKALTRGQPVGALGVCPQSGSIVAAGEGTRVVLLDPTDGTVSRTYSEHGGALAARFTADGKRLLLLQGGELLACDVRTGARLSGIPFAGSMNGFALSPDAKVVAVVGDSHQFILCDLDNLQGHRECKGHEAYIQAVAFSPDGKFVVTGSHDRTLRLWEVNSGKEVRQYLGHGDQVAAVAFMPGGKRLASGSWDCTVRLWEVATGKELSKWEGHRMAVTAVAVSPDGGLAASASLDGTVRVWATDTGKCSHTLAVHEAGAYSVAFTRDGKTLLGGDANGQVTWWDVKTGQVIRKTEVLTHVQPPREDTIWSVAFAPDGKTLATGGADKTVRLFASDDGKELRVLGRQAEAVWSVAFAGDGKTVASAGRRDAAVHLLAADGSGQRTAWVGPKGGVSRIAYSPDGKTLFAGGGSFDPTNFLWDVGTGKELLRLGGHSDYVGAVAFSGDGKQMVSASWDGTLRLWDQATGKEVRQFAGAGQFHSLAYLPMPRLFVASSGTGVIFWDPKSGEQVTPRGLEQLPQFRVTSLTVSPDGTSFAWGGADGNIQVWEVFTGKLRRTYRAHTSTVHALVFSCDGKRLASASADGTAIIWDLTRLAKLGDKVMLTPQERDQLWDDLASMNAALGYDAIWKLAADPKTILPRLDAALQADRAVDPVLVRKLIEQLGSERFAVREQATVKVREFGSAAAGALREALAKSPSPEARVRINQLLEKLAKVGNSPEELRALRCVEILEHIGTAEAERLLVRLAGGADGTLLTRTAQAALERVWKRT